VTNINSSVQKQSTNPDSSFKRLSSLTRHSRNESGAFQPKIQSDPGSTHFLQPAGVRISTIQHSRSGTSSSGDQGSSILNTGAVNHGI